MVFLMKIIGAIILIAATTTYGINLSLDDKKKYQFCDDFSLMCDELLRDLKYMVTPAKSLLYNSINRNVRLAKYCDNNLPLNDDENGVISLFLNDFGKCDIDTQISKISSIKEYTIELKDKYYRKYLSSNKIYITFGFFSGSILTLIMI